MTDGGVMGHAVGKMNDDLFAADFELEVEPLVIALKPTRPIPPDSQQLLLDPEGMGDKVGQLAFLTRV